MEEKIKIEEVNVNNIYGYRDKENYPLIFKINRYNFTSLTEFPQDYRPIELDEETLIRSPKFLKAGDDFYSYEHNMEVQKEDDYFSVYYKGIHIKDVKYVHEMQNLFRLLSGGEELLL